MTHSAIVKKQNQMLPILFWPSDVGRFHAAGIGVSFGCIFSVDGGWAGAIAGESAPTGMAVGFRALFGRGVWVGLEGSFSIGGGLAGVIASRLASIGGVVGWLGFGIGFAVFGFFVFGSEGKAFGLRWSGSVHLLRRIAHGSDASSHQ
jgi:hypothetical protein